MKEVIFPEGITTISTSAFANCTFLSICTLPTTITSIGASAFSGCSGLSEIKLLLAVTTIGANAFSGCSNLTIYAEAPSKPGNWDASWNPLGYTVNYGRCSVCKSLLSWQTTSTEHSAACSGCSRAISGAHDFTYTFTISKHTKQCDFCGYKVTEVHSYTPWIWFDNYTHKRYCACGSETSQAHTSPPNCSVCFIIVYGPSGGGTNFGYENYFSEFLRGAEEHGHGDRHCSHVH